MEKVQDIYNIYKKTLIAMIISAVCAVAVSCAYIFLLEPIHPITQTGVREIGHAGTADTHQSAEGVASQAEDESETDGSSLFLSRDSSDSQYMWIPVDDTLTSAAITIENHYMDRQLWVSVEGGADNYYDNAHISGNLDGVSSGSVTRADGRSILKFNMDHVYEYNTIFEDSVLYVEKVNPKEAYDRIVIIDPAGYVPSGLLNDNSLSPERICLDISSKLLALLEDKGIRVYVTSLDERVSDDEDSLALLTDVRPDMYIRIETAYSEDSKVYGTETVYNGTYFIPGFGSVELADMIEAHVATSIGGKAVGLAEAGDRDTVIKRATVPAAAVRVGYYTNMQENILLNRDDYRCRIAEGILDAVMDAYGE